MQAIQNKEIYYLVADIGGTNARFALTRPATIALENIESLSCRDYSGIDSAIESYLQLSGIDRSQVEQACIAVATPVKNDLISLTNNCWSFSCTELVEKFSWQRLQVINDFTALALSLPLLASEELEPVGGDLPVNNSPKALIGPGTGLGVSGLIPVDENNWLPLQGEGGHVTCNGTNVHQAQIIALLQQRYEHVSAERLISGPGLENIYQALTEHHKGSADCLNAEQITQQALNGDCDICIEALDLFCLLLGNIAGNLALTLGANGGVYIGGGIVPRLGTYFSNSPFRQGFEQHGRFADYLHTIPCYVIHSPGAALSGAAQALIQNNPYIGYRVDAVSRNQA